MRDCTISVHLIKRNRLALEVCHAVREDAIRPSFIKDTVAVVDRATDSTIRFDLQQHELLRRFGVDGAGGLPLAAEEAGKALALIALGSSALPPPAERQRQTHGVGPQLRIDARRAFLVSVRVHSRVICLLRIELVEPLLLRQSCQLCRRGPVLGIVGGEQ